MIASSTTPLMIDAMMIFFLRFCLAASARCSARDLTASASFGFCAGDTISNWPVAGLYACVG